MPKFFIKTYGCQMNERDSEQVAHSLIARGYERVAHEREADVVLLNTCSVRDMADQKALGKMGMLGRMAKERPHMVFGFLGCMAQARGEVLLENLPHVDLVVGTQKFHRVADYVEELVAKKTARSRHDEQAQLAPNQDRAMDDLRFSIVDIAEEPGSQSAIRNQQLASRQATAFVSIMQGCNMHCTFCIVPQTRGTERSRSIDEIVREVRDLVARGVKEVTLLGQIVNLYGRHEFPKREGNSITTDIIVGFPGETEKDYKQTRALVEEIQFDNAFVFRYSPRRDTPAAEVADQIDEHIKEQRNQDLLRVVNESARRSGERLVGRPVQVLCEGPSTTNPTRLVGRTRTNKIVVFEGNKKLIGEIFDVQIQRSNGFSLYGMPLLNDCGTF